jgi:DNA modification methylase
MPANHLNESTDLRDLIPDPQNARSHGERNLSLIASSLREVGAGRSIVVDEDGTILAGNATVAAAARAGIGKVRIVDTDGSELIAVRRSNLTDDQKRQLALFDNRAAELAGWDTEVLTSLADDLDLSDLWDDDELADLLGQLDADTAPSLHTEPDDVPDMPSSPITQPGDLWRLGPHRLLCGDATKSDDLAVVLDGGLADLIVTDPPYGVAYEGKTPDRLTIANDDLDAAALGSFLAAAFTAMHTVTKPGGAIYCFHADSHGLTVRQAFRAAGWLQKQTLIWVKPSLVLGRQDYHWRHEPILYGWKPGASHYFTDDRTQTTVWEVDRPSRSAEHPTMKPVELLAIAIANSSRPGAVVLDPFAGSGSTLIACEQLGRRARLVELDPRYCEVIVQRWEAATGQTADRVSHGDDAREPAVTTA